MVGLADLAEPLIIQRDGLDLYVGPDGFPKVLEVSSSLLVDVDPRYVTVSPGLVHFHLRNGHAMYRIAEIDGARQVHLLVRVSEAS